MPCRSWEEENPIYVAEKRANDMQRKQDEVDRLTTLLCYACKMMNPTDISINGELGDWWEEHQEQDRRRMEIEKAKTAQKNKKKRLESIRKRLQAQLTDEEKEAIGL